MVLWILYDPSKKTHKSLANVQFIRYRTLQTKQKRKDLIFAGRMNIESGKIIYIDNDSEHYSPTIEESINFVNMFKKLPFVSNNLITNFK